MPCIPSARDITSLYSVVIATIDANRTLKRKEKAKLSYSKRTHKAALWVKFSNVNRTSEHLVIKGCDQIHTASLLQPSDSWQWTIIIGVTCNVELRSQEMKLKLLTINKTTCLCSKLTWIGISIDWQLSPSLRTGDLQLHVPFPPYAPFNLARHSIDSFIYFCCYQHVY